MQDNVEVLPSSFEGIEQRRPLLPIFKVDLRILVNQGLYDLDVAFLARDHKRALAILLVHGVDVSACVQEHLDALLDLVLLERVEALHDEKESLVELFLRDIAFVLGIFDDI